MNIEPNTFICADSNEVLRDIPDRFCDLCLTDPPYGIGVSVNGRVGSGASSAKWPSGGSRDYGSQSWDLSTIGANAFEEIQRVSKQQVVWGGNYYAGILGGSNGWLVWDKGNNNPSMSDCELAWTSTGAAVKKFDHLWAGFRQQAGLIEQRFHPTQKPVPLFVWCLLRYSKPGDLVIDPFCGSGTTALACHKTGRRFICIDREPKYIEIAQQRYKDLVAQQDLFKDAPAEQYGAGLVQSPNSASLQCGLEI
jgi:site-specific DNA-methyltransferase (adenine-specific)